jgi:hypothetical protein
MASLGLNELTLDTLHQKHTLQKDQQHSNSWFFFPMSEDNGVSAMMAWNSINNSTPFSLHGHY